ncbi:MAG: SdrD B-like domain-containing protein, partial [Candidatus Shapirobacteria bacterium]|nr:SdrD B-like domain-containing protein [Candidatus Shapirobacteria bacterium]
MYKKTVTFKLFSLLASLNLALQPIVGLFIVNQPFAFAQEETGEEIVITEEQTTEEEAINNEEINEQEENNSGENEEIVEESLAPEEGQDDPTTTVEEATDSTEPTETPEENNQNQQEPDLSPVPDYEESAKPNENPPEEEPTTVSRVCLEEGTELTRTVNGDWEINEEEGFAQTLNSIQLGVTYIYPQEEKVTVTFTCLPEDEGLRAPLKIQKIKITDLDLPEDLTPYGEYAYDITTDMENGTFEYDITLPGPENQEINVSYLEDVNSEAKIVEEEKVNQEGDSVRVESLDHFTIYVVVVNSSDSGSCSAVYSSHGGCYATIQEAIDNSSPGDEIWVGDGAYEPATINKPLTIKAGSSPIIDCGGTGNGFLIQAENIVIDGFEIKNCTIGIRTYGGPSSYGDLSIINSYLHNNSQNGILMVYDSFNKILLENLLIESNGQNGIGLANDLQAETLSIKESEISNNGHHGTFIANTTINNIEIINSSFDNSITNGYSGITIGTTPSQIKSLKFMGGSLSNNNGAGMSISQAPSQFEEIFISNIKVENNKESGLFFGGGSSTEKIIIENSLFKDNGWEDVDLSGGWFGDFGVINMAEIAKNNFYPSAWVKIYVGNLGNIKSLTINKNNFYGVQTALYNENSIVANVDLNWWDSQSGPGEKISGPNTYQEWLCEPYETEWYSIDGQCDESKKVTICHATNSHQNPYIVNTPNKSGTLNGHVDHTGPVWYPGIVDHSWGDIIPPFTYSDCPNEDTAYDSDDKSKPCKKKINGSWEYADEVEYQYLGLNWSEEGRAIWENGCEIPPPPLEECGNGIVEGNEQCDDKDGVTPGENFCTANCKLVPIYNGENECPPGTVRGNNPVASTTISSTDPDGEVLSLTSGKTYLFEASGQYEYWTGSNDNYMADAGYATRDNWATLRDDLGIRPDAKKRGVLSLLSDMGTGNIGITTWGGYNENHTYQKAYTIQNNNVTFLISDWYNEWYDDSPYNYNNQQAMKDNRGSLNLDIYECVVTMEVEICKEDDLRNRLSGWEVALASEKVDGPMPINVSDSSGTNSSDLEVGKYLIKVSGTYRYGSSQMIADAGYSYRPIGIPDGINDWVSGWDLSSGSNGLMVWINGNPVNWGALNEPLHVYTHVYDHSGGSINFSIYDNYYGDNLNNGSLQFEIYKIEDGYYGQTEKNGCVSLSVIPGEYILDEILPSNWINLERKGDLIQVDSENNNFILKNRLDVPVTIIAHKIICSNESYLPNWGAVKSHGNPITADTAQNFVDNSQGNCWFEEDWGFEWGPANSGYGGDNLIGPAGGKWNIFGPTGENGKTQVEINDLSGFSGRIEMREILKEGYIPFTYATSGNNNSNNVSAEFYCHNDVMNYDNWEWINNPQYGQTYYCVAFNAPLYGSISGYKWEDLNGNRNWDNEEPILGDWAIELKQGEQVLVTETTSVEDGGYSFENILPGEYEICEVLLEGWKQTYPNSEENESATCHSIVLEPGEEITDLNFGNLKLGYIQGRKYEDLNQDGSRQTEESWLGGWEISLYDNQWNYLFSTTTAENSGIYRFENLDFGTYYACEVLQDGWTQTGPILGGNRVTNESVNKNNEGAVCWRSVFNQSGQARTGRQFGNIQYGSVEVYKFDDVNGNGVWDENENEGLLPDWEIVLGEETKTTDNDGKVVFTDLTPGQYDLSENIKEGWIQTNVYCASDSQDDNFGPSPEIVGTFELVDSYQATVNPSETTICYIGNFQLGQISGYKIYDRNDNGTQEKGEGGIKDWEICLTGDSLVEAENCTLTDEEGYYEFTDLIAGTYIVTEEDKSAEGWRASNPENGKHENIEITSGSNVEVDFYNA